ncbi:hypothetical protein BDZ91DRAFT_68432 [Kalaharituber pfeilii]|nr:hypothetical protein BDZ91DRAFT_68432 [Kalaharituber pfeilii]
MDPISIGSSICALVGIGSAIYFGLEDIKGAPHAIENVRLEIAGLRTVLTRLKHLLEQDVNSLNLFPDDVREDLARNLQSLMDIKLQLSETLQSYMNMSAGKWLSSVIRQLKWVLVREKDVEKLRKHLEAHKNTLGLTLMMMSNLCLAQIQDQLNRRSSSASQMSGSAAYCGACPGAKLEDIGKYVKKLQDQVNSKKGHGRGHIHRMRDLPSNEEVIDCSGVQRYVDSLAEFVRSGKYEQTVRTVQSAPRPPHDESAPAELMEALKSEPTPTSACASNEKSDNCPGCDQTPPANRPSRNALIWPPILNEPVPWDEKKTL